MIKDSNDSMKHHENAGPLQDWYGIMVLKNRNEGGKKSPLTRKQEVFLIWIKYCVPLMIHSHKLRLQLDHSSVAVFQYLKIKVFFLVWEFWVFFFFLKILCHGFIINIVLLRFNYSYILFYNYQSLVNFTIKKKRKKKNCITCHY